MELILMRLPSLIFGRLQVSRVRFISRYGGIVV